MIIHRRSMLLRLAANILGLWISASIFGNIHYDERFSVLFIAGLMLFAVNLFIKPLLILLSLPAVLLSLGLFLVVINGLMIELIASLYKSFSVDSFGAAILAGLVIGLVNYLVTVIVEDQKGKQ